jgi:hypothetical protein
MVNECYQRAGSSSHISGIGRADVDRIITAVSGGETACALFLGERTWPVVGSSIARAREGVHSVLGVSPDTAAFVDGEPAEDGHLLRDGEVLEFVIPFGHETVRHEMMGPRWDSQLRRLWFGPHLVKEFKQPAGNQECILRAFQESDWRPRIDDPIPQRKGIVAKKRLRSTVDQLNKFHKTEERSLRFRTDGTAEGVIWETKQGPASAGHAPSLSRLALVVLGRDRAGE